MLLYMNSYREFLRENTLSLVSLEWLDLFQTILFQSLSIFHIGQYLMGIL